MAGYSRERAVTCVFVGALHSLRRLRRRLQRRRRLPNLQRNRKGHDMTTTPIRKRVARYALERMLDLAVICAAVALVFSVARCISGDGA